MTVRQRKPRHCVAVDDHVTRGPRPSVAQRAPLGHRATDQTAVQRCLTSFSCGKETTAGVSVEIDPELTATAAALTVDRGRRPVIRFAGCPARQLRQSVKIADERR